MKRTVMICACAFAGVLWLNVQAQQARSLSDGVYSAAQAIRGQEIYKAQCAECHGNAMEGTVGSPLAGDSFLSNWSARPLSALVDKIQKTMPFNAPGSLSRQQSADLDGLHSAGRQVPGGSSGAHRGHARADCISATIADAPAPPRRSPGRLFPRRKATLPS